MSLNSLKNDLERCRMTSTLMAAAIILCMMIVTCARNHVWRDELTLWSHIVAQAPRKERAHMSLGAAYGEKGYQELAIRQLQTALTVDPNSSKAHNNLGVTYFNQGRFELAIKMYDKALVLDPGDFVAYVNRGNAYDSLGKPYRALSDYDRAITINPAYPSAYNERALVFMKLKLFDFAKRDLQMACELGDSKSCSDLKYFETR